MMVLLLLLLFSNESGQDNPFRPDGDLSREADELVELLKGGRPISEVLKPKEEVPSSASPTAEEPVAEEQPFLAASPDRNSLASPTNKSPTNKSPDVGVNGVKTPEAEKKVVEKEVEASKSVEVERAVVAPTEANPSQAEHVVIKKKSKCQCCVIQWFIWFDFWTIITFIFADRDTFHHHEMENDTFLYFYVLNANLLPLSLSLSLSPS